MVFLVLADSPCYCGRELETRESLVMGASVRRAALQMQSGAGESIAALPDRCSFLQSFSSRSQDSVLCRCIPVCSSSLS